MPMLVAEHRIFQGLSGDTAINRSGKRAAIVRHLIPAGRYAVGMMIVPARGFVDGVAIGKKPVPIFIQGAEINLRPLIPQHVHIQVQRETMGIWVSHVVTAHPACQRREARGWSR